MKKHRTTRWLGRFVAALLLLFTTVSPVKAAVEFVAPIPDGGIWLFWDPSHISPPTSSPDVACNSGYNSQWNSSNVYTYLGSVPNQYGYAGLGYRDCKFLDTRTGTIIGGGGSIQRVPFPPVCPVPTVNPTVSYSYNVTSGVCEREEPCLAPNVINPATGQCEPPEILSITLDGGTTTEPGTSLSFIATVTNQNNEPPKNPVTVQISLKVDPTSGGHDHGDSARPRGGIATVRTCPSDVTCWSETSPANSGVVMFNFKAPEASGTHTITATCDGCSNTVSKTVGVKVEDLELIPTSVFYTFIGETDKHSDNHYLTLEAEAILWRIAASYQVEPQFKLVNPVTRRRTITPPVLHVNDASLKWGGKFDLSGRWAGSHYEHRRGTVVDIRANALETAIPVVNFRKFQRLVNRYGAFALLETPSVSKRHFHLRLLNREE